jgi:predicted DCC family thiol-disulfide oxidoreductase YuxK
MVVVTLTAPRPDARGSVVLFDGVCNLCNSAINFILDHEDAGLAAGPEALRFASLQSAAGQALAALHGARIPQGDPDSVLLVEDGKVFDRSLAALRLARHLSWPWKLVYAFVVVPRPLRDAVYKWIARNRYRWFGKRDVCRVPTPELRARFLTD